MKKKVLSVILAAVCTMGLMAGCGAEGSKGSTQSGAKGDSYTVGISQFAEHGSLDNCREGFLEGLKEEGIEEGKNLKVDYQNAQTDTGTASTIADSFVSEKVDMICAIATPCAASAYNSAMNADIPTVYTAVSDPVVAGLAKEDGSSVGNITGSSDVLPVEEQLKMIRQMMPDAKKIGILYTTSEANSCSTIEEYKELADKYDFFNFPSAAWRDRLPVDQARAKVSMTCQMKRTVFLLQFVVEKEKSTPLKRIEHYGKQAVNLRQRRCGSPVR